MISDDLGHWLAGLVAGEGCFHIARRLSASNVLTYRTTFCIQLRDDDHEVIELIQRTLGIGRIYRKPHYKASKPQIGWMVSSRDDVAVLVDLFTRYPLRAKKARDFEIWKRAAAITSQIPRGGTRRWDGWAQILALKTELENARVYPGSERCTTRGRKPWRPR